MDATNPQEIGKGDTVLISNDDNVDDFLRGRKGTVVAINPHGNPPLDVKIPGDSSGPYGFDYDEVSLVS